MKKIVFHPYAFGLYSVLFLVSVNLKRIPISASYRILAFQFIVISLLFVLFRLISRSWYRAGLATSLAVILFNSYGHVYTYFSGKPFWGAVFGKADILGAVCAASFILVGWWIIRKLPHPEIVSGYFNIFSIVLLVFPMLQIVSFLGKQAYYTSRLDKVEPYNVMSSKSSGLRPPDIYYLILDEYGREDVLKEVMSFDNSDLTRYLQGKGFYVAADSHTNYSITQFSLQSSLNLKYLDPENETNTYSILELFKHNQARKFLEAQGYQFITFATGYSQTDIIDADYFFAPKAYINSFEFIYLQSSAIALVIDNWYFPQSRALITNAFERLKSVPEIDPGTPKFVFAHIPAAHIPFVFGPDGEMEEPWTLYIGSTDPAVPRQGFIKAYTGQLIFINRLLEDTVNAILSKSEIEPIIIIQSDHGSHAYYVLGSFDSPCIKERLSILNAYYLPGFDNSKLYPSISPVNTFRLIFDHYFGTNLGLLEDRSYLTIWDNLSNITDATNVRNHCEIPSKQ